MTTASDKELMVEINVLTKAATSAQYQAALYENAFNRVCEAKQIEAHERIRYLNQAMKEVRDNAGRTT